MGLVPLHGGFDGLPDMNIEAPHPSSSEFCVLRVTANGGFAPVRILALAAGDQTSARDQSSRVYNVRVVAIDNGRTAYTACAVGAVSPREVQRHEKLPRYDEKCCRADQRAAVFVQWRQRDPETLLTRRGRLRITVAYRTDRSVGAGT